MTDNSSDVSETLDQVIAEYLCQVDAGAAPDRNELIARHPEFAEELQAFFANRDHFDRAASPLRVPPQRKFVPPTIRYFGDYELLDEIARGGMGVVYKARQVHLNRTVAIKMILSGNLASDEDVRRFQREAQAAANLQHPNIVSVHEVGMHDGHHYFSMDYVDGRSLAELIREHPARPRQAAAWVGEAATAIHYAHQQGTLHRDLKPSNILVDRAERVRITDFGLATRTTADQALTQTGQIVGTPSYMPPEQAQSKRSLIGPASDVYALGAILYELLTGRPPFRSDSAVATIQQVVHSEPVSPRLLNPGVPRDLETICLKCLQKEPHRRYLTAELLAGDLERFLRGEPILARPIGRIARVWRWCRRNPLPASLASAAIALLLTIAGGATIAYLREAALHKHAEGLADDLRKSYGDVSQLRRIADELRANVTADQEELQDIQAELQDIHTKLGDAQTRTTAVEADYRDLEAQRRALAAVLDVRQQKLYSTLLFLAQADWDAGEVARADAYLEDCPLSLRDRRWNRLKHLCRPQMQTFGGTRGLAISSNGRWLATSRAVSRQSEADAARWEIVVWDLQNGQLVRTIPDQAAVQALVFRPDSSTLISGGSDAIVRFWDIETGSLQHTLSQHAEPITSLSLSADGRRMASTSARQKKDYTWDGETLLWDLADLTLIRKLSGIRSVAIDPSGLRLAYRATETRTANGKSTIYSYVRLEPVAATDQADTDAIEFDAGVCTFSPDRSHIALSHDGIEIWSLAEKQRRFHFRVYGGMHLAFSPDGTRVAYAVHGTDRIRDRSADSVIVRNLQTGARERIFPWYQSRITGVAFTPDGLSLVTTDAENVKVWDISPTADPTEDILKQIRLMNVGPRDWSQWGGSPSKVNAPAGDHIPTTWKLGTIDSQTGAWRRDGSQNVKWAAQLGTQTYGNPVVANGRVFVGTNNGNGYLERYPNRVDLGVLLCFDEATGEFLWQHSNEKLPTGRVHDWPMQGVCSTPSVDGDRLWYVTNRGEVVCLDTQGFADGEDDGPIQGVRRPVFAVRSDLSQLARAGAQQPTSLDEHSIRVHLSRLNLPSRLNSGMWRKLPDSSVWEIYESRVDPKTHYVVGQTVLGRFAIEEGELRVWSVSDGVVGEQLAAVPVDLVGGLDAGNPSEALRRLLRIDLHAECPVETVQPGREWRIRARASTQFDLHLQLLDATLVCEAEIPDRKQEADVVWKLDMIAELGVSPHNMSNCSPLIVGDWLFVCTSNGVDEGHRHIPAPDAPSFIALDRWTGKVLWTDNSPGTNILHAQWGSPSYGVFGGQPQVIFPGGDGWVYGFDPRGDGQGHSKLLWKFDGNFKDSRYLLGGRSTRNHIIAFPAIYDGLVYIVMGEDPEHGEGPGCLWCLDPAKGTGGADISESLAVDAEGHPIPHRRLQAVDGTRGEKAIPNPNSAVVWRYTAQDRNGDGVIVFEEEFHRSLSVPVIKDDILYVADFSGLFHCLNAKTGKVYWAYDMFAACWNSALLVDGKVFVGDEDGDLAIFRHSPDPEKAMKKGEPWFGEPNLSTSIYMTPIVANNVLYLATKNMLYAIQPPKGAAPFGPLPDEEEAP